MAKQNNLTTAPQGGAVAPANNAGNEQKVTPVAKNKAPKDEPKKAEKPNPVAKPANKKLENDSEIVAMLQAQLDAANKTIAELQAGKPQQEDQDEPVETVLSANDDTGYQHPESNMDEVRKLMAQLNVGELHENSKGEYFTEISHAINSEKGKRNRVKTHVRSAVNVTENE